MTEAQAIELITQRFVDQWPVSAPGIPYVLPNKAKPTTEDVFVQLEFLPNRRISLTVGKGGTKQHFVWIVVMIFVRENTGTLEGNTLADAARHVFEDQELSLGSEKLQITEPGPRAGGRLDGYRISAVQAEAYWFASGG